jgi:hypothetical protein
MAQSHTLHRARPAEASNFSEALRHGARTLIADFLDGKGWRFAELLLGTILIGRGVAILVFDGMDTPTYRGFWGAGYPLLWGVPCVLAGLFRCIAVLVNGYWRHRSPRLRMAGAAVGFIYYLLLTFAFGAAGLPIAIMLYGTLAAAEFLSWVRASIDLARARHAPLAFRDPR